MFVWPGGTLPMNAYFLARPERAGEPALRAFEAVLRRVWNM